MAPDRLIKTGLWLYFWLLLFEGVLRKWVLPGYSDVLFIVRDPLVLAIYVVAFWGRIFPWRPATLVLLIIGTLSLGFAVAVDTPLIVTLFGLRTNYLHFPLVYLMAQVLDRDDVLRFGRWTLLSSVPIIILMVVQFDAEPDSLVNVGAGGVEGAQIRGAVGKIRPPGPFSFTSGVVGFFALVMVFVVHRWLERRRFNLVLTLVGSATLLLAIPISISRSLSFALLVIAAFLLPVMFRDLRRLPTYLGPLAVGLGLFSLVADSIYVKAYMVRWQETIEAGGGGFSGNVIERLLDGFAQPFQLAMDAPLLGHGVGLGTIAGARLTTGTYAFVLAESELTRMVMELGPLLGFAFIAWRGWLAAVLVLCTWRRFLAERDSLPWLLAGCSFLPVLSAQLGPATSLGFVVFSAGLTLGSLNDPPAAEEDADDGAEDRTEDPAEETAGAAGT